jgi:hypothetical protein
MKYEFCGVQVALQLLDWLVGAVALNWVGTAACLFSSARLRLIFLSRRICSANFCHSVQDRGCLTYT